MMRTFRERAIVLRAYRLGEADRILVLLGERTGQFRAVAKGVRRTNSKFGARLQSFNLVDVQCYRGRSDLVTLTQAETISAYSTGLTEGFGAFTGAKAIVEAAARITENRELPSPEQFGLLHGALHSLAAARHPASLITASYLLRTAAIEGWQPSLGACAVCGKPGYHSRFSVTSGGAVCGDCGAQDAFPVGTDVLELMEALMEGDWNRAELGDREAKEEALEVAGTWLQWQLEQRLKALRFVHMAQDI